MATVKSSLSLPSTAGVYGIYGSLGGGKTLSAVDIALAFLDSRNIVCSNVALKNLSKQQVIFYRFIPDISTVDWFSLPAGSPRGTPGNKRVCIILDELPELLDQYSNGKEFWIKSLLSWLRHTSKNGQFVFLITQDPSFIMKSVRVLCSYWIRCDDMAQLRLPIFRIRIPFLKDKVLRRIYDRDGNCLNHTLNLVSKSRIGRYYTTSQGLSLYNNSPPETFRDLGVFFLRSQLLYKKFTVLFFLVILSFFISLFLLLL